MEVKRNEIKISSVFISVLANEFDKSKMTVHNALRDITQTPLAKKIRQRAKEMLLAEAASINETQND